MSSFFGGVTKGMTRMFGMPDRLIPRPKSGGEEQRAAYEEKQRQEESAAASEAARAEAQRQYDLPESERKRAVAATSDVPARGKRLGASAYLGG